VVVQSGAGEFFGGMALLRDEPRSATVRAITAARVWSLSVANYAAFIREIHDDKADNWYNTC
jgi:CRP-like cAMP-binding protein